MTSDIELVKIIAEDPLMKQTVVMVICTYAKDWHSRYWILLLAEYLMPTHLMLESQTEGFKLVHQSSSHCASGIDEYSA
jgi:hypothetical protein